MDDYLEEVKKKYDDDSVYLPHLKASSNVFDCFGLTVCINY